MSYDMSSRTFGIYSEDLLLLGDKQIELKAFLTEYISVTSGTPLQTTIEIIDPCINPFSLIVPA